jgi:hypothetical protein
MEDELSASPDAPVGLAPVAKAWVNNSMKLPPFWLANVTASFTSVKVSLVSALQENTIGLISDFIQMLLLPEDPFNRLLARQLTESAEDVWHI